MDQDIDEYESIIKEYEEEYDKPAFIDGNFSKPTEEFKKWAEEEFGVTFTKEDGY